MIQYCVLYIEVQKVAGKHLNKLTLEGVIESDETYPHAGEKGIPQRNPRKRGFMETWTWKYGRMINHL